MKLKFLIATILGTFCIPVYAQHKTFYYDTSTLFFREDTVNLQIFKRVIWSDSYYNDTTIGVPELPVFHHSVKIADNVSIDSVTIILANGISGALMTPIMPHQRPTRTGITTYDQHFVINENVYHSDNVFPKNCLISYSTHRARKGNYLSLDIIPFQYFPNRNEYIAYSTAEVYIHTHEENNRVEFSSTYVDIGIPYYEYTIITSPQLLSAFEPFAQWKRAKGYQVGIINVNDILNNSYLTNGDEISHISDEAGKLRQYLIYSYNAVGTKYVLLGGDASTIPIRYAYDSIPSDFYYSELTSNWDQNCNGIYGEYNDFVDYGAEVYVGRLLCTEVTEVKNWTKKVLQYEINPGNGDYSYLGRAFFSQEDHMQKNRDAETIQQKLHGSINCTIFNEYPSYDDQHPSFPTGSEIIENINNIHYGLLSNFNHGGPYAYGVASKGLAETSPENRGVFAMDAYDEDPTLCISPPEIGNGFDSFNNEVYPSVMYSTSCKNMPFDQYMTPNGVFNLGRVFTCRSKGGGPAYIGNTRNGYTPSSTYLFRYFLDSISIIRNNHLGIAEAKSKMQYQNNYLRHSHNILGCPETSLYIGTPEVFDNHLTVNISNNHIVVNMSTDSVDSRICLSGYINDIYKQYVYKDRCNVTFDTIPETYTLVISKPNYVPYVLSNDSCILQNINISTNETFDGCDTFKIGSDISPFQPYGRVTIENGGSVVIDVGDEVIIKNDFEVKMGGQLIIH